MKGYKLTIRIMADSWTDEWEREFDSYEQAKEFAERTAQNKPYLSWIDEDWDTIFVFTDKIIDMMIESRELNDKGDEKRTAKDWVKLVFMLWIVGALLWFSIVNIILPALWK